MKDHSSRNVPARKIRYLVLVGLTTGALWLLFHFSSRDESLVPEIREYYDEEEGIRAGLEKEMQQLRELISATDSQTPTTARRDDVSIIQALEKQLSGAQAAAEAQTRAWRAAEERKKSLEYRVAQMEAKKTAVHKAAASTAATPAPTVLEPATPPPVIAQQHSDHDHGHAHDASNQAVFTKPGQDSYFDRHFQRRCAHLQEHEHEQNGKVHVPREHLYAIIGVHSVLQNSQQRNAIRETWAAEAKKLRIPTANGKNDVRLEFVIADHKSDWSASEQATLDAEMRQYEDIVLLPHIDKKHHFTGTTRIWFQRSACFYVPQFLIKVSDDTYVRVPELMEALQKKQQHKLYWGHIHEDVDGHEDEVFNGFRVGKYMPFANGNVYVLSADVVEWLAKAPINLKYFKSEDVSVGMWVHALQLHVQHEPRFTAKVPSDDGWYCRADMLSQPKLSATQMRSYHEKATSGHTPCEK